MNQHLTLAINLSVFLILLIFCALLPLPLKLLFQTRFETPKAKIEYANLTVEETKLENELKLKVNFHQLPVCPYQYNLLLKSSYLTDRDGNCTLKKKPQVKRRDALEVKKETHVKERTLTVHAIDDVQATATCMAKDAEKLENERKGKVRGRSVPMVGHILAVMLIISAIVALVEVLRIRLFKYKETSVRRNAMLRKESSVDMNFLTKTFPSRQLLSTQQSIELQGMNKSNLRLLGARPPPLIRRSSFPTQVSKDTVACSNTTSTNRSSRRPSVDCDDEISGLIIALHHRTRLIRRH